MENDKGNKSEKNCLGGSKNPTIRCILVGIPTIAGAYLGWRHGSEFVNYTNDIAANSGVFYHQIAVTVPLLTKVFGAYFEGKILNRTGCFITCIAERFSQKLTYLTENTERLNKNFEATRAYNYYATLGRAEYEKFVESFILKARKSGKFSAVHIDSVKKILSESDLEGMLEREYLVKEMRLGAEVISPTIRALKAMYGTDKHHEVVCGPFGYFEGEKIISDE
jgi:hypothetical protein